jgi:hypothetical protein
MLAMQHLNAKQRRELEQQSGSDNPGHNGQARIIVPVWRADDHGVFTTKRV